MICKYHVTILSWSMMLFVILVVLSPIALGQDVESGSGRTFSPETGTRRREHHDSFLLTPLEPQNVDSDYHPISASQRLHWFVLSTASPSHLVGIALVSAGGTGLNRPYEYGPHWDGFGKRTGMSSAGSVVGNSIEASAGFFFREDPRYFRLRQQRFKTRIGSVIRQTFTARNADGGFVPAYARYIGVVGGNFLSNSWRVHSEANAQSALLRASEGFAGRMATNAYAEFWPDVRDHLVRHHR